MGLHSLVCTQGAHPTRLAGGQGGPHHTPHPLGAQIYAFTAATSSLSESHSARVLFMLCTLSESLGIAFVRRGTGLGLVGLRLHTLTRVMRQWQVFSGFVTGLAASARPFDDTVST